MDSMRLLEEFPGLGHSMNSAFNLPKQIGSPSGEGPAHFWRIC